VNILNKVYYLVKEIITCWRRRDMGKRHAENMKKYDELFREIN